MPHPVDVHVGQRIRDLRKSLRMSQAQLAQHLGLTFQQVQKYERGTNRVSASKLYEMGGVLGVDITAFYDGLANVGAGSIATSLPPSAGLRRLVQAFEKMSDDRDRDRLVQMAEILARPDQTRVKAGS